MIQVNRIYLIFNRLVTKKFLVDTSDEEYKTHNNKHHNKDAHDDRNGLDKREASAPVQHHRHDTLDGGPENLVTRSDMFLFRKQC